VAVEIHYGIVSARRQMLKKSGTGSRGQTLLAAFVRRIVIEVRNTV